MHWSGNLYNGLDALAVRIETLLIVSSSETVRPPREIAFALALYVWSLAGEVDPAVRDSRGAPIFEEHCSGCHAGVTGAGDPVEASVVGTDGAVARSPARGTGRYRVPSLHRVGSRSRLTHEGRFASVEALLNPARAGSDPSHPFGLELASEERTELIAYLNAQ